MKEKFSVFYEQGKVDFDNLDDSVLVVLDANILLHFFRYSEDSKMKLFGALEKVKDNIFVPYHAAVEYHFGRQVVDRSNDKNKEKLERKLVEEKDKFATVVKDAIKTYGNNIRSKDEESVREEILARFSEKFNKFWDDFTNNDLIKETSLISDNSDTLVKIGNLLDSKVGERLDNLETIEKEGANRYENMIPPGYMDLKEKEGKIRSFGKYKYNQMYGDLILWHEIIEYCKKNPSIKHVFLVTDDQKEDWVYQLNGKTIGARVELKQELYEETKAKFDIMGTNTFLINVIKQEDMIKKAESTFSSSINFYDQVIRNESTHYIHKHNFKNWFIRNTGDSKKTKVLDNIFFISKVLLSEQNKYIGSNSEKNEFTLKLKLVFEQAFDFYEKQVEEFLHDFAKTADSHIYEVLVREIKDIYTLYHRYKSEDQTIDIVKEIDIIIGRIENSEIFKLVGLI